MVRPVSGISRVTPPATTNTWSASDERQAAGEQLAERVADGDARRGGRAARAARRARAARSAGQPELLAEAARMKSVCGERHEVGPALPEAGAEQAAAAHAEQRLDQLVARCHVSRGSNGCSQMSTRACDVAEQRATRATAPAANSTQADEQPAGPLGGDVEHHHEEAEEQQRGAEVALEDQDAEADQPGDEDRAEVAAAGQVRPRNRRPASASDVALAAPGSRRRRRPAAILANSPGWNEKPAEADPDPGAVDARGRSRQERQQQQRRGRRSSRCTCSGCSTRWSRTPTRTATSSATPSAVHMSCRVRERTSAPLRARCGEVQPVDHRPGRGR